MITAEQRGALHEAVESIRVNIAKDLFEDDYPELRIVDESRMQWFREYAEKHLAKDFPNARITFHEDWAEYLLAHGNQWTTAVEFATDEECRIVQEAIDDLVEDAIRFAERA